MPRHEEFRETSNTGELICLSLPSSEVPGQEKENKKLQCSWLWNSEPGTLWDELLDHGVSASWESPLKWAHRRPGQECSAGVLWQPSASGLGGGPNERLCKHVCVHVCVCTYVLRPPWRRGPSLWVTKTAGVSVVRGAGWAPGVFLALEGGGWNVLSPVSGDNEGTQAGVPGPSHCPAKSSQSRGLGGQEAPPASRHCLLSVSGRTRMTSCTSSV